MICVVEDKYLLLPKVTGRGGAMPRMPASCCARGCATLGLRLMARWALPRLSGDDAYRKTHGKDPVNPWHVPDNIHRADLVKNEATEEGSA